MYRHNTVKDSKENANWTWLDGLQVPSECVAYFQEIFVIMAELENRLNVPVQSFCDSTAANRARKLEGTSYSFSPVPVRSKVKKVRKI